MKLDIEALKAVALAATPGPWDYFFKHKYNEHHVSLPIEGSGMRRALFQSGCKTDRPVEDAQFIAAANPAAVLALIERLERTERNRDMWKAQCERQAEALEKQARAAKTGMDAAKAGASAMQENARRMLAESNPDALASERQANAILTAENERLREELRQIYSHQAELAGWKP